MEKKGLRANAGKTKIMICGLGLDLAEFRRVSMSVTLEWAATAVGSSA